MVVTIAGHCRSPVVVWQVVKLVSFCFEKNLVTTGLTWHPSCTILEYPERILQTINVPGGFTPTSALNSSNFPRRVLLITVSIARRY
jgi:hypothetical protein